MTITVGRASVGWTKTVRAVALVGFYRGDLVSPGQILDLPESEFAILKGFCKVDYAPPQDAAESTAKAKK
jgi:hypothetical protein